MTPRLKNLSTLRVNPLKPLSFYYGRKRYEGLAGDSVATALYANHIRVFSRSIKYHRPRGLYNLDGDCANAFMEVNGIPNVPTELTPLRDQMRIRAQNVVGTPEWDLKGFMDKLDWAMPAGFYYHFFHRPYRLWPFFRSQIRKAAGIGAIDPSSRLRGRFETCHIHAEVCVVGGGPAGMAAAKAAADCGLRVVLLEARPWFGGCFDYRNVRRPDGMTFYERAESLFTEIKKHPGIRRFPGTHLIGLYPDNHLTAIQRGEEKDPFDEKYLDISSKSVVITTGCRERPLLFEHNDRPGIMQPNCALRLARTYGLLPGKRAVFSVGHDLGLEAAMDLHDLGLHVVCVADTRVVGQDPRLMDGLAERKIPLFRGGSARFASGKRIQKVTLNTPEASRNLQVPCDLLVASAGPTPNAEPLFLSGAKMIYDPQTDFFLPESLPPGVFAGGMVLGFTDPEAVEGSGTLAGLSAVSSCGVSVERSIREIEETLHTLPGPCRNGSAVRVPTSGRKTFVCFDEDTTTKHVRQACDLGFDTIELCKRFTAAGTGPGQGKIPGHNLPLLLSEYRNEEPSKETLPSTVRSPLFPTLMAAYAGPKYDIAKHTPTHDIQKQFGAVFRRVGAWKRARYFSSDLTCTREIGSVRRDVGLIDVSTLGKFRIFGPNALEALQRVYVGDLSRIREGRVKYSAMCNDDACLLDDGVILKTGEDDYYFTTSTGRADSTMEWIQYHTLYDQWHYHMVNLTDAFGALNLAGPKARHVLSKITTADLSPKAFPYATHRDMLLCDCIPARVLRLGFLGELSYEIHLPASMTETLWKRLMEAGEEFDIRPFGLEAQNVLRLEKGHIIIGQESEIRTTLHDLGLGFLWQRRKHGTQTVGSPALRFTEHQPGRMKLVGFEMEGFGRPPKDGSIIVDQDIRGHVCTARYSVTLKKAIGLALVDSDLSTEGTRLTFFEDGMEREMLNGRVVRTPFLDPEGNRMRI